MIPITFRTSRIKQLSLLAVAGLMIWLLWSLAWLRRCDMPRDWRPMALALIPGKIFLVVTARVAYLLIKPDELRLTADGWSITRYGRRSDH